MDRLAGRRISLRPLALDERRLFFRWATHSDATPYWYGELYGDDIPSFSVFKLEWPDHYFQDESPNLGRAFGIELDGYLIGEVNYNEINPVDYSASLDILIASEKHHNRGYGTEAIALLTQFLFESHRIRKCEIEVISRNPRAYRTFEKAGYHHVYTYVRRGFVWHVLECMRKPNLPPVERIPTPKAEEKRSYSNH